MTIVPGMHLPLSLQSPSMLIFPSLLIFYVSHSIHYPKNINSGASYPTEVTEQLFFRDSKLP